MDAAILNAIVSAGFAGVMCIMIWKAGEKRTDQFIELSRKQTESHMANAAALDRMAEKLDAFRCHAEPTSERSALFGRD